MTDLDRYGLFALAVVILLILFISLGDLECDEEPGSFGEINIVDDTTLPDTVVSQERLPGTEFVTPAARLSGMDGDTATVENARYTGTSSDSGRAGVSRRGDFDFEEGSVLDPEPSSGNRPSQRGGYVLHRVKKGESLSTISQRYYGTANSWRTIADANGDLVPSRLKAGAVIKVPRSAGGRISMRGTGASSASTAAAREHVVRKNENLAKISKRYYGTYNKWRKIYDANRSKITDPDVLEVGMSLTIPR